MPREFIANDGRIYFRTRLLTCPQADRFARCLRANAERFRDVDVSFNPRAKGERAFFVTFRPVNPDRVVEQIDRQQASRQQRADCHGPSYVYALDIDGERPFYWCLSDSGETYELDSGECSCPDYQYRLKRADWTGIKCKHILEMQRRFDAGMLQRLSDVYASPEWRARHNRPAPIYGTRPYTPSDTIGQPVVAW